MAWPYDARHKSYSALTPVAASELNEFQDQIQNIAGEHVLRLLNGFVGTAGGWLLTAVNFHEGWELQAAGGNLIIPIPCREGAVLSQVEIKVEASGSGAWSITLVAADRNWDTSASAPTGSNLEAATPSPSSAWATITMDATSSGGNLPHTVAADEDLYLVINAPNTGDHVAGVRATFDQLY